jgi:proline dehydrogenase
MARPGSFARRFVAGETIDEALAACRALQAQGAGITLDLLGESVTSLAEADLATRAYASMMERMAASAVDRNISLKLTQLGHDIDRAICSDPRACCCAASEIA